MKQKAKIFLPFLASALLLSCAAGTGNEQTVEIPPAMPAMGVGRVPSSETTDSAAVGDASGSSVKTESGEKPRLSSNGGFSSASIPATDLRTAGAARRRPPSTRTERWKRT